MTRHAGVEFLSALAPDVCGNDVSVCNRIHGALFDKDTGIRVIMELELFEEIVEAIHKDLGHYGKKTTLPEHIHLRILLNLLISLFFYAFRPQVSPHNSWYHAESSVSCLVLGYL